MTRYDPAIKASIRRRMANGKTLAQAFHGLKTELWKDERRLDKAIDELRHKAKRRLLARLRRMHSRIPMIRLPKWSMAWRCLKGMD